jgi:phospholipase D1/2
MAGNETEERFRSTSAPLFDNDNSWLIGRASRFGWLIDGEDYFRALRDSIEAADREILIVGWDIDSTVDLIRDESHPLYPSPLAETLQSLVERKASLQVRVLSWDFAIVYVLERQLLPAYRFGWQDSERLHFFLDGEHATGASHHQKFVVIDGDLAFIGGLDITKSRWDSREHAADDPRRVNTDGEPYRPFHDVQAIVSGEVARQLRQLAAFRWKNATGNTLPGFDDACANAATDTWPEQVPVQGRDVPACLARTWAKPDGSKVIREVERLFEDMIAAAEDNIYIENQYFTSVAITDALCARLGDKHGPEIVLVLPAETSGWLEQLTMEVLRNKALNRLCAADEHHRLEILAPVSSELGDTQINVHSKVMVVDDRWVRIGSANLSGRSMGLDSECDLVVEDDTGALATKLRADLLAEHLGTNAESLAAAIDEHGLLAGIREHNGNKRSLARLDIAPADYEDVVEPLAHIADLEKPVELPQAQTGESQDRGILRVLTSRAAGGTYLVALILGVIGWAIWAATQGEQTLDPMALLDILRARASYPLAPLVVIPAFVAGSILIAPVTGMIALCALLFSPWIASLSAIAGTLAATLVNYAIGHHLGKAVEGRAPRSLIDRIHALGRSADAWALAGLRLIPVAPFSIVNLLAGTAHVPLREFLLGTLLGMGPGIVLICFSVDRARAALSGEPLFEPWLVAVIVGAGISLVGLRVWQKRRSD